MPHAPQPSPRLSPHHDGPHVGECYCALRPLGLRPLQHRVGRDSTAARPGCSEDACDGGPWQSTPPRAVGLLPHPNNLTQYFRCYLQLRYPQTHTPAHSLSSTMNTLRASCWLAAEEPSTPSLPPSSYSRLRVQHKGDPDGPLHEVDPVVPVLGAP